MFLGCILFGISEAKVKLEQSKPCKVLKGQIEKSVNNFLLKQKHCGSIDCQAGKFV